VGNLGLAHDSADVFDDQGSDQFGMMGGELVGRDAPKGVSEHHCGIATQSVDYRGGVSHELGASKEPP
jgi:hypothetical protein